MTNRLWVTWYIAVKGSLITSICLWPTVGEWHWNVSECQSHHILSHDHQRVSDIAHCMRGNLITTYPVMNRKWGKWASLHIFWVEMPHICPMTKSLWVRLHIFVRGNLISSYFMTNRMWVTLHIFSVAMSSHLCYDQQLVGDLAHFSKRQCHYSSCPPESEWHCTFAWEAISLDLLQPTVGEWHYIFSER